MSIDNTESTGELDVVTCLTETLSTLGYAPEVCEEDGIRFVLLEVLLKELSDDAAYYVTFASVTSEGEPFLSVIISLRILAGENVTLNELHDRVLGTWCIECCKEDSQGVDVLVHTQEIEEDSPNKYVLSHAFGIPEADFRANATASIHCALITAASLVAAVLQTIATVEEFASDDQFLPGELPAEEAEYVH